MLVLALGLWLRGEWLGFLAFCCSVLLITVARGRVVNLCCLQLPVSCAAGGSSRQDGKKEERNSNSTRAGRGHCNLAYLLPTTRGFVKEGGHRWADRSQYASEC